VPERQSGGGRAWIRPWLVVGLAAWVMVGVLLVTRADAQGLVDDISISPYHVVGYAALLVLAAYVAWTFFGAVRRGDWRTAFPPLYGGLGVGFLMLLAWVVLDPIWRDTLGIREGIEAGLAPTRLLIPAALALLAVGPVREAIAHRAEPGLRRGELAGRWAGVAGAGLLGAALTLVAFNPVQAALSDVSRNAGTDNSEIWTMEADGTGQTRLLAAAADGVDFSLPAWSPDGSRIAYTTWSNEGGLPQNFLTEDQSSAIWSMAVDGSDRRLVADGAPDQAWIPAWSPDGQWIAYTVSPTSDAAAGPAAPEPNAPPGALGPPSSTVGASIWLVRPDGSEKRRLSPEGTDAFGAVWSPQGDRVAYLVAQDGGTSDIHVASFADSALSNDVTLVADQANDWGPAWSPDGELLAFVSDRSGNDEIWTAPSGGGEPTQLTDEGGGDWVPAYSPDGSRIAFVSDRTGNAEVWSMAPDGTDPRNLSNQPFHFDGTWSVSWSPDGARLAYGAASFQDAAGSGWVREDLAAAQALLFGLALSIVALVLIALGAQAGAFTIALLIMVAMSAIPTDGWRFLPAALAAGLLTDGLVRSVRPGLRGRIAAAMYPALATLAMGITIGMAGTLSWSLTLLLGVALAAAALGWGLAELVERMLTHTAARTVPGQPKAT
jgi:Tol biopolymer transport system component